jgi:hypothetical protein
MNGGMVYIVVKPRGGSNQCMAREVVYNGDKPVKSTGDMSPWYT